MSFIHKFKLGVAAGLLATSALTATPSLSQGVPTVDVASIAKLLETQTEQPQ